MITKVIIDISIIKLHTKKIDKEPFQQNPTVHIMQKYNKEARRVRENMNNIIDMHNIKYYSNLVIVLENYIILKSTNKIIKEIDTTKEEMKYIAKKFPRSMISLILEQG